MSETLCICSECGAEVQGIAWDKPNGGVDGVDVCPECGAIESGTEIEIIGSS